jgi:pimeloyl-ACP methyl ester carboxylesterase
VAPDLLGFGESERPRRGLDADQHVQSLADAFREVFPGRAAIVVASGFAAALAVKLSTQHPELVRSLVLLAPEGFDSQHPRVPGGIGFLARIPKVNGFLYRNSISRQPFVRGWLARFGFRNPAAIGDDVVEVLTTCAGQYGAEHAILAFLRGRMRYDVRRQLSRVTQPTTLLWPEGDPSFPASSAIRIKETIPFCRSLESPQIGPLAALECPEVILPMLRSALGPSAVSDAEIAA